MEPKIFIGCVTYGKDVHALPYLLDSLRKLEFAEIHFVDTTEATAPQFAPYTKLQQELKSRMGARRTFIHQYVPKRPGEVPFEVIANSRNQLREIFLGSDCTHLFFVDDDMTFPEDTLKLLLSHKAPVAVGVYINGLNYGEHGRRIAPIAFIESEPGTVKPLMLIDVVPPRVIKVLLTGFGCCLIERSVLEQVPILYDSVTKTTEDTPFYLELDRRNIPVLMDTRVKCGHLKFPIGDQRNAFLDFSSYQVKIRPK